jgi:hypothetical protein
VSLSDALGIKTAVSDVTKLQAAITKLDLVMNKGTRESNRSLTRLKPNRPLHQDVTFLGLDEEGIKERLTRQEGRIRKGRFTRTNPENGITSLFSAGGAPVRNPNRLNTEELVRLQQFEAKIRKNQIAQIQRAANAVAQADKERIEARQAEARAIIDSIRRSTRLSSALDNIAKRNLEAERMRFAGGMQGNKVKGGFFGEAFDTMRNKQERGTVESTGDFFKDTIRKQRYEQMVRPFEGRGKAERTARAKEAARQFAKEAGFTRNKSVDPASREGKRFTKTGKSKINEGDSFRSFLPGAHRDPKKTVNNTLGISKTATNLLALSSVLAPLNAQLGAVVMQAGFAAFSLGAPAAALSLLASAASGFAATLKKAVTTAKEAGLETVGFSRSTIALETEIHAFMLVLGVEVQRAFEPVVDELTELFKEVEKLPWKEIVSESAKAAEALLSFVGVLTQAYDTAAYLPKTGAAMLTYPGRKAQDLMGKEGKQRIDFSPMDLLKFGGVPKMWEEFREFFGGDKGPERGS